MKQIAQKVSAERTLIKTDKNGTKHYSVDACPRCGGTGIYVMTTLDEQRCWKCGGNGYFPHIEKEYTQEYLAKQAKKHMDKEKELRKVNIEREIKGKTCGLFTSVSETVYAVTGSTYSIRNELKEAGAKYGWFPTIGAAWYFRTKQDKYPTVSISFMDIYQVDENYYCTVREDI